MELFLIDAVGPFFRGIDGRTINWSKIPFADLPLGDRQEAERAVRFARIREDMAAFADRVAALGFNAVTLDDVAHLADAGEYEPPVRAVIRRFRAEFVELARILEARGLGIFVTMDVLSFTPGLRAAIGSGAAEVTAFAADLLARMLDEFPSIRGVILRIGESDGRDVRGTFRSELVLRDAPATNRFLRALLPVFEARGRRLILRTWTVGAYRIGDLIWHRDTFRRALEGIESPAFVVSMKYGESDFFRYLPLNRNFFRTDHAKLVEVQTRREYEGCGEFPAFVGGDHARFAHELRGARNVIGLSVWCQTGGWVPFRRLAFLDPGSPWTELETAVTLRLFRDGVPVEEAVERAVGHAETWPKVLALLRLSEEVIREGLYVQEFARQKLFFRRVRVPPLLSVYWSTLFVNHSVRKILGHFVTDPETAVRQGWAAVDRIATMEQLAREAGLPVEDIIFMKDTFRLFALAREYHLLPFSAERCERILAAKRDYQQRYPRGTRPRFRVVASFEPFRLSRRSIGLLFGLLVRRRRGYRLVDRILLLRGLALVFRLLGRTRRHALVPEFAKESAMGIDVVFR